MIALLYPRRFFAGHRVRFTAKFVSMAMKSNNWLLHEELLAVGVCLELHSNYATVRWDNGFVDGPTHVSHLERDDPAARTPSDRNSEEL